MFCFSLARISFDFLLANKLAANRTASNNLATTFSHMDTPWVMLSRSKHQSRTYGSVSVEATRFGSTQAGLLAAPPAKLMQ